jgi:hypothetical protein
MVTAARWLKNCSGCYACEQTNKQKQKKKNPTQTKKKNKENSNCDHIKFLQKEIKNPQFDKKNYQKDITEGEISEVKVE